MTSEAVMTLVEGSSSGPVLCAADAEPEAEYIWMYSDQIVSTQPVLAFDTGISKTQAGEYVCIAKNKHGRAQAITLFDVQCE